MGYGKTIITYLVDGSPTGIKTVELSNWIGKAIIIPRVKLKEAKKRQELLQPAIYFLFGINEKGENLAYIGEAENFMDRISNHDTNKDFWEIVIGFISKDNNLTKADVKYLEAKAIERAKKSDRYILQNSAKPISNNLPEYQISTMNEFLDNIDLLISAIGYPILKEIKFNEEQNNENIYFLNSRGSQRKGILTEEGFLVLKGSKGRLKLQPGVIRNKGYAFKNRPILLAKGIIKEEGESIVFLKDYLFNSPSSSASFLSGASLNGWVSWKNKDGKTLREVERKNLKDN